MSLNNQKSQQSINPQDKDLLLKMERKRKQWEEEEEKRNKNLDEHEVLLDQILHQTSGSYKQTIKKVLGRIGEEKSLRIPVMCSIMSQATSDILEGKIQDIDDIPDDVREFISNLLKDIGNRKISLLPDSPFWKVYDTLMQRLPDILQERLRWVVRATITQLTYDMQLREGRINIQKYQEQTQILDERIQTIETELWEKPHIQRVDERENFSKKMEELKNLINTSTGIFPKNKKGLLEMLERLPIFYRGFYDSFFAGKSERDFLYRVEELPDDEIHAITFHYIQDLFIQTRGNTELVKKLLREIRERGKNQKIFFLNFEPQFPEGVYTSGSIITGCMIVSPYDSGNPESKSLYIGSANILEDYRKITSPVDILLEDALSYAFTQEKAEELYCHVDPGSPQERLWKSKGFEIVRQERDELVGGDTYITLMKMTRETYRKRSLENDYKKLGMK